jgi:hypothetical protein
MTDNIQDLIQHIGQLAFNSLPSGQWNIITLTVRAITSYVELNASYIHHEKQFVPVTFFLEDDHLDYEEQTAQSFEKLRQLMYNEAPFRGAWYTAVMSITDQGRFDTDFEYEERPKFDHKPVEEAYVLDFQHFPRNEESTPAWLKEIVQKHGLKYHVPEPLG